LRDELERQHEKLREVLHEQSRRKLSVVTVHRYSHLTKLSLPPNKEIQFFTPLSYGLALLIDRNSNHSDTLLKSIPVMGIKLTGS